MSSETSQLIVAYLDGRLDATGVRDLNGLLRSDVGLRREAAHLLMQELQLREIGQEQLARVTVVDFQDSALNGPSLPHPWLAVARSFLRHQWPKALAASLTAIALFLLVLGTVRFGRNQPRLARIEGFVTIERKGQRQSASNGLALRPGDLISLRPEAWALVTYPGESTWFWLSDSAEAMIDKAGRSKIIVLRSGALSAVVAPQPKASPVRLVTPQAEAAILGTELGLSVKRDTTRLDVWKGQVRLTRTEDGAFSEVSGGEYGIVHPHGMLVKGTIRHGLVRDYWLGLDEPLSNDRMTSYVLRSPATGSELLPVFEVSRDWGDRFLARVRGYLRPPTTGRYRFWITGDDGAELWLSADDKPDHKTKICSTSEWTRPGDWERNESQKSSLIALEQGRSYYIEALQHEWAGGDCLAVAWLAPGKNREILAGEYLVAPPAVSDSIEQGDWP